MPGRPAMKDEDRRPRARPRRAGEEAVYTPGPEVRVRRPTEVSAVRRAQWPAVAEQLRGLPAAGMQAPHGAVRPDPGGLGGSGRHVYRLKCGGADIPPVQGRPARPFMAQQQLIGGGIPPGGHLTRQVHIHGQPAIGRWRPDAGPTDAVPLVVDEKAGVATDWAPRACLQAEPVSVPQFGYPAPGHVDHAQRRMTAVTMFRMLYAEQRVIGGEACHGGGFTMAIHHARRRTGPKHADGGQAADGTTDHSDTAAEREPGRMGRGQRGRLRRAAFEWGHLPGPEFVSVGIVEPPDPPARRVDRCPHGTHYRIGDLPTATSAEIRTIYLLSAAARRGIDESVGRVRRPIRKLDLSQKEPPAPQHSARMAVIDQALTSCSVLAAPPAETRLYRWMARTSDGFLFMVRPVSASVKPLRRMSGTTLVSRCP